MSFENKRGYDIINGINFIDGKNNSKNKDYLNNINMVQKKVGQYYDNWEKIKLKSNENSLIDKKPIYKEPYDYSDIDKNFEKYIQNRKATLMNSRTINRSYGAFKSSENTNSNNNNNYRNSYTAADFITRINNGNSRKCYSHIKNDNRTLNGIRTNKMDKNMFFGLSSFLVKKIIQL